MSLENRVPIGEDDRRDGRSEEELIAMYQNDLENLMEHQEIWIELGLCDGRSSAYRHQSLAATCEDAKTLTALYSDNYCVYGSRDDVLAFLRENTLKSIYVENVLLWS